MNAERLIAGIFAGSGGIYLLHLGHFEAGIAILMGMLAFFVGEYNGSKKEGKD